MPHKTLSTHELIVHAWWCDTQIYSDHFFDTTASLKFDALDSDLTVLFQELQMIRASFEEADYPPVVTGARQHLLNSMSKVLQGFKEFVAGNVDGAHYFMHTAQYELNRLEDELMRLGVPASVTQPVH